MAGGHAVNAWPLLVRLKERLGPAGTGVAHALMDGVILATHLLVNGLALWPAAAFFLRLRERWPDALGLAVALSAAYFVYLFAYVFVSALFKRIVVGTLKSGRHAMNSPEAIAWRSGLIYALASEGFALANVRFFLFTRWLHWRLQGARFHPRSVQAADCVIYEPDLVEMGEGCVVGLGAVLVAHLVTEDTAHVRLGRIRLGRDVLVGAGAMIGPSVRIDDGAVVGTAALVGPGCRIGRNAVLQNASGIPAGTRIPDGEIWAGVPARKVGSRAKMEAGR